MTAALLNAMQRATPLRGAYSAPPPVTPRAPQLAPRTWGSSRDYVGRLETVLQNRLDIPGVGLRICTWARDTPFFPNPTLTLPDAVLAIIVPNDGVDPAPHPNCTFDFNVGDSILFTRRSLDDIRVTSFTESDDGPTTLYVFVLPWGAIALKAADGVTITPPAGKTLLLSADNCEALLTKTGANAWSVAGDLAAA
jgi:hypothetical protein